ncbi:MAG: RNA repair domain-containing protein [Candidatus Bathyarchaeia archaeon]
MAAGVCGAHPLKNILTGILWSMGVDPGDFEITYIHRGAPQDRATVKVSEVVTVGKSWFSHLKQGEETVIPFHRVMLLRNIKTGQVLWERRGRSSG